jgi:hypothetical protein
MGMMPDAKPFGWTDDGRFPVPRLWHQESHHAVCGTGSERNSAEIEGMARPQF